MSTTSTRPQPQSIPISSSSTTSYKIKSNNPEWSVPSSFDRRKMKFLTVENRLNSATGVKVRTEYIKSRLLTEQEEILAGRMSSIGKKLELIRKQLKVELDREPTYEEWAAKCNITRTKLESYIDMAYQARNVLVLHNMRLVDFLVRGILESSSKATQSLSYFELVTEGIIGLTHAAENYDGRCRFATYSHFFIRSSIYKCISRLQPGSLVTHKWAILNNRLKKIKYSLKQSLQREPTELELAKEMNCNVAHLQTIRERALMKISSAEKSFNSENLKSASVSSLSQTESVGQTYFELDLLSPQSDGSGSGSSSGQSVDYFLWKTNFKTALNILEPSERRVLGLRYGFIDGISRTIPLTAELMCVSEESIRLTTIKALEKLKSYQPSNDILSNGPPSLETNTINNLISAKAY